ncbi:MAG: alpha/beta hydrolase [Rhizobiales bacterium]|nr:alpha/beta hydrolase [Hyphomicrobiales bacterium]
MLDQLAELPFADIVFSPVAATTLAVFAVLYALWLIVRRSRYSSLGYAGGWFAVFGAAGFALAIAIFTIGDGAYMSAPMEERAPSMSRDDGEAVAPRRGPTAAPSRPAAPGGGSGGSDFTGLGRGGTGDGGGGTSTGTIGGGEAAGGESAGEGASESVEESEPAPRPKRRKIAEPVEQPATSVPKALPKSLEREFVAPGAPRSSPSRDVVLAPPAEIEPPAESAPPESGAEPSVGASPRTGAQPFEMAPRSLTPPADSQEVVSEPAPEPFETVRVFFGTDRADAPVERSGVMSVGYGSERGRRLALGAANVTVPSTVHQAGEVERPFELTILGVTIYREKEDPAKHFTIADIATMSPDEFVAAVNAKLAGSRHYEGHAIVFVHGYNVAFDSALYRTAQIAYDLGFDGAPFLYSWPSNGSLGSYESDQNNSEQAERYLREFIDLVLQRTNARHVSFIAHSMGNKPLLKVLKEMQIAAEVRSDLKVNQIILAAPDIDRDVFADLVAEVAPLGQGVTLYASANDRAMVASRAYAGGIPRAGDISELGPVLEQGLDTIDVSAQSTAVLALNHSTYAEKSDLLADIGRLILEGVRPPRQRTPALEEKELDRRIYWRFPPTGN